MSPLPEQGPRSFSHNHQHKPSPSRPRSAASPSSAAANNSSNRRRKVLLTPPPRSPPLQGPAETNHSPLPTESEQSGLFPIPTPNSQDVSLLSSQQVSKSDSKAPASYPDNVFQSPSPATNIITGPSSTVSPVPRRIYTPNRPQAHPTTPTHRAVSENTFVAPAIPTNSSPFSNGNTIRQTSMLANGNNMGHSSPFHPTLNSMNSHQSNASTNHLPHPAQDFQAYRLRISRSCNATHQRSRIAAQVKASSAIAILNPNSKQPPSGLPGRSLSASNAPQSGSSMSITSTNTTDGNAGSLKAKDTIDSAASNDENGPPVLSDDNSKSKLAQSSLTGRPAKNGAPPVQSWTTIDMGGMNLKVISASLFQYGFLTVLYLNHNSLTSLPPSIVTLAGLVLLDISGNLLSSLPPELGLLTRLRELLLFDNHITAIPPEFGSLFQLDFIGLEGNPLPTNLLSLLSNEGTPALITYLRDNCPVPPPPPKRSWHAIENPDDISSAEVDTNQRALQASDTFKLLCYNILCELYASPQLYGYTPKWALDWQYRKRLILQEIMSCRSDIICLQEVALDAYEEFLLPSLHLQGFEGIYCQKTRAKTMGEAERRHVDGCATFYRASKFALVERRVVEFGSLPLQRSDFAKTEDLYNRVLTKNDVAAVALLENKGSGSRLLVANVHIHWNPEYRDVKLIQVAMLMGEIERINNDFAKLPPRQDLTLRSVPPVYSSGSRIPTIICGDFNSIPASGVYELMANGSTPPDHEDFMAHRYGKYTTDGPRHGFALKSAYSAMGELPLTNYTPGFEGVIDYMWYNSSSMSVSGVLGEVDPAYLSRAVGFPDPHFPSDHICLHAEFRIHSQPDPLKAAMAQKQKNA